MTTPRAAVTLVVSLLGFTSFTPRAPEFSEWAAAVNLGATSKDGLTLYFGSDRSGGSGGIDIWVSQRASRDEPWGAPVNLGPVVNSTGIDNVPAFSRDEHWMFFNSNRPGSFGGNDIWASFRQHTKDPFGWTAPVNLGPGVNTPFQDQGASFFDSPAGRPVLFFNSDRPAPSPAGGQIDIYVSEMLADGSFGMAQFIVELSTPAQDQRPSIRFDGLEMLLFSNRPGSVGNFDLWASTRAHIDDAWSTPLNLGVVNSAASVRRARSVRVVTDARAALGAC